MEITAALAADLALLTQALDEPPADLTETLGLLVADIRLAVRSYLGLRLTVGVNGHGFDVTVLEAFPEAPEVRASIRMPLRPLLGDSAPVASMVLYAANPGAFVDLSADLSWLTGQAISTFILDDDLVVAAADGGSSQTAASTINQAIGVLIGHGHTPHQAHGELDRLALAAGTDRHACAIALLRDPRGITPLDGDA